MKHAVLLLLAFAAIGHAVPNAERQAEAYRQLVETDLFCIGGMGPGGVMSPREDALRTLLRSTDRKRLLRTALDEATPAGKMYALCGLYYGDPTTYREVVERYRNMPVSFESQSGCMRMQGSRFSFHSHISVLEAGLYRTLAEGSAEEIASRLREDLKLPDQKYFQLRMALWQRWQSLHTPDSAGKEKPVSDAEKLAIEQTFRDRVSKVLSRDECARVQQALGQPPAPKERSKR